LCGFSEPARGDFIQPDGHENLDGQSGRDEQKIQPQGVERHLQPIVGGKEKPEVLKTNEFASQAIQPGQGIVVDKSDIKTDEGHVAEYEEEQNTGKCEQIEVSVSGQFPKESVLPLRLDHVGLPQ